MKVHSWATKSESSFLVEEVGLQSMLVTRYRVLDVDNWATGLGE